MNRESKLRCYESKWCVSRMNIKTVCCVPTLEVAALWPDIITFLVRRTSTTSPTASEGPEPSKLRGALVEPLWVVPRGTEEEEEEEEEETQALDGLGLMGKAVTGFCCPNDDDDDDEDDDVALALYCLAFL